MRRVLPDGPAVIGVVNVTPDSFSDGGQHLAPDAAVAHGVRLVDEGAACLDVGAESTRPGAAEVSIDEECDRLLPVLEGLRAQVDVPLSVDTRHAATAERALDVGADLVNDVSMLRHDQEMASVVGRAGAGLLLMHSRSLPSDMQLAPSYDDVVVEVKEELAAARDRALAAGCHADRLWLDPGFGFAKTAAHNAALLRRLAELGELGHPLVVGLSRKSFIGHLLRSEQGPRPVSDRLHGSIGAALAAVAAGASHVRVHDVRPTVDALRCFLR